MIVDYELLLSDAQAVTADAASTQYIDTQVAGKSVNELWLVVNVNTTLDSAGEAGTLSVILQTDDDSAFGSATDLYTSQSFAESVLAAGYNLIKMRLPTSGLERYVRLYYNVNNSDAFTSGKIDAYLTPSVELSY